MNCIVTDIDGTIAEKTTEFGSGISNWERVVAERPPPPIIPMRTLLQAAAQGGMYVLYATARREALRSLTTRWLAENAFPFTAELLMRPDDIRLSGDVLKVRYLKQLRELGWNPTVWFEDDGPTVDALRAAGVHAITC